MLDSAWHTVDGLRLHASVGGSGPPLVLVHGIGVSSRYLLPSARALAADFSVYAVDLPGSGRSESPRRALDVPGLARALAGWLDALGLERSSFLANSLGCQTVAELAVTRPERVDRLVLTGPTIDRFHSQLPGWIRDLVREPPSLLPLIARDYARFGPLRFVATARAALADRIEQKLPRIEAPTLVIRGSRDGLVSQRWVEHLTELLPHGRLAVIPGAAHALPFSVPDEIARLTRRFLS